MTTDPLTDAIILDPSEAAPEAARAFLSDRFWEWGVEDDFDGRLIVSELVTNSFLHGAGAIVVRVFRDECSGLPVIEVWDESEEKPVLCPANYVSTSGRGMRMVDALAADWGVRPLAGGGKAVWAILAT
ncbi:ATP-binding protein [Spirillospora sp. NBC_01491]|uniref:ATP-binding protein n=1 Tax=Spirillospora sp. NBC_01491 TaxID=2976007 RepID=UPI002E3005FF|nr:ATP-binding protein [Spirillospora sp. NBC_01491]